MSTEYRDNNHSERRGGGSGNRDNRGGRSGGYNQRRDDRRDGGYRGDRDDRRSGGRGYREDDRRGERGGYRDDRRDGRDFDRRDDRGGRRYGARREQRDYQGERRYGDREQRGYRSDRDDRREERGERSYDRERTGGDRRGGGYRDNDRRYDDRDRNRGYERGDRRGDSRHDGARRHDDRRDQRGYGERDDRRDNRDNARRYDDRPRGGRDQRDFHGDRRDFDRRDARDQRGYGDQRDARGYRETSDGFEYDEDRDESSRGGWYEERRDQRERNRGYSDRRDGRKPAPRRDERTEAREDEPRPFQNRQERRAAAAAEREREAAETYDYIDFEGEDWDDDAWIDDDDDAPLAPRPADPNQRRVEVRCPVAKRCGGCEWLAMPYEEQLEVKQEHIEELFSSYKAEPEPIIGMEEPWGYRNKVQLPFAPGRPDRDGRTTARWGIFERGSHNIVPCQQCLVEDERARPIIATVASLLPRFNIKPYHEKKGEGVLRYCLVRTAHTTGQIMLTLVCNGSRFPSLKAFLDRLLEAHPQITTVVLNVNTEKTSVILGKEEKVLYGPGYIEDELCGCRFRISSSSFYQTNPVAAEALYNLAVEMADLKPGDRIGDAYCGTGTIGIVAAKQSGAHLLGVERNADAVEDARINAQLNGIEDAEFIAGDAGSVFARMARAGESLDVVFMDPPRAGSSQAFLANLSRLGPRRVVYISCEPRTQVHDITALLKNGYRVTRIRPVDMFPHTNHVENVVLLERTPRWTREEPKDSE